MTELRFHEVGAVEGRFDPRPWPWAEAEAARIDAHWARLVAQKPALYDGPVLLLHGGGVEGDAFRGIYLETRYSRFMAWRDFGQPDRTIRNAFSMAALRGADGPFLLAVMGGHTANAGQVYFPSGTPDLSDVREGRVDLAGSVARELEEETGLRRQDVTFGSRWTIVEEGQKIALLQPVVSRLTAEDTRERILATLRAQDEPELSDIRMVRDPGDIDPRVMPAFMVGYLRRELQRAPAASV